MSAEVKLTAAELAIVHEILGRFLPRGFRAYVFGSRATGAGLRATSDLDLAIDEWRLRRVAAAAAILAPRLARPTDDIRIDVMLLAPKRLPRHLVHVWQP